MSARSRNPLADWKQRRAAARADQAARRRLDAECQMLIEWREAALEAEKASDHKPSFWDTLRASIHAGARRIKASLDA